MLPLPEPDAPGTCLPGGSPDYSALGPFQQQQQQLAARPTLPLASTLPPLTLPQQQQQAAAPPLPHGSL